LGKMEDVAKEGRTVLFVSHNMVAIENLCSRAILLNSGRIFAEGDTRSIIQTYLQKMLPEIPSFSLSELTERRGTGQICFTYFHVEDIQGNKLPVIQSGQDVVFVFGFKCANSARPRNVDFRFGIYTLLGERLTDLYASYVNQVFETVPEEGEARCLVRHFPFASGRYIIRAAIAVNDEIADFIPAGVGFIDVMEGDFWGTGKIPRQPIPFLISGEWFLTNRRPEKGERDE